MRPVPFLYRAYVVAAALAVPFVARSRLKRLRRDDVAIVRAHEILGNTALERPGGSLIWFHAASVGESLSVLPIITAMGQALPNANFLITSATPTSARMIAAQMPPRCTHQFAPLDSAGPVTRFLKRWRPDAAVFVESEIWPQMLVRARAGGIPLALVGARMSLKSLKRWAKLPQTAQFIFGQFSLILTQNQAMTDALNDLVPDSKIETAQNLKSLSPALRVDLAAHATLAVSIGTRPCWTAASTHPGEEESALDAHKRVLETHPDALLILAPRHPERSSDVQNLISESGLSYATRSKDEAPTAQVFLADTLGELGLWYSLAPLVFLGGSLENHGGHNPFEVALAGAAILSGPQTANFSETYSALEAAKAVRVVHDAADLGQEITALMSSPAQRDVARSAAASFAETRRKGAREIAAKLVQTLGLVS